MAILQKVCIVMVNWRHIKLVRRKNMVFLAVFEPGGLEMKIEESALMR